MVICIGARGAGKTVLLKALCDQENFSLDKFVLPTVGVNIFRYPLPKSVGKGRKQASLDIRELGGELAPIWQSYLSKETKVIFVINTQALSQVALVGVKLTECLSQLEQNLTSLNQLASLCLVWTKLDRVVSGETEQVIDQLRRLLRLGELTHHSLVNITEVQFNVSTGTGLVDLEAWLGSTF